jgi:hypothetical protein
MGLTGAANPVSFLCLECRTVLDRGEVCDLDPRHPVAPLDSPQGRERVLGAVWGPAPARQRARQLTRAGVGGGAAGGILEGIGQGCGGCGELAGAGEVGAVIGVILAIVAVALFAVVLVWLIGRAVVAWQRRKHRLLPRGAARNVDYRRRGAWVEGVVEAKAPMGSWTGQADCVAWGLEVRADKSRDGDVLMRDGRTAPFTVRLADGRRVEVPAGRVRVQADGDVPEHARETVTGDALKEQLGSLAASEEEYEALIPGETAEVVMLNSGDRVRVHGPLEAAATGEGGYREGAAVYRPAGVAWLTRVG